MPRIWWDLFSIHKSTEFRFLIKYIKLLNKSDQSKIYLLGQEYEKADYIFNNNISEVNKFKNDKYLIPQNFRKINEFKIRGYMIYEIYKKF